MGESDRDMMGRVPQPERVEDQALILVDLMIQGLAAQPPCRAPDRVSQANLTALALAQLRPEATRELLFHLGRCSSCRARSLQVAQRLRQAPLWNLSWSAAGAAGESRAAPLFRHLRQWLEASLLPATDANSRSDSIAVQAAAAAGEAPAMTTTVVAAPPRVEADGRLVLNFESTPPVDEGRLVLYLRTPELRLELAELEPGRTAVTLAVDLAPLRPAAGLLAPDALELCLVPAGETRPPLLPSLRRALSGEHPAEAVWLCLSVHDAVLGERLPNGLRRDAMALADPDEGDAAILAAIELLARYARNLPADASTQLAQVYRIQESLTEALESSVIGPERSGARGAQREVGRKPQARPEA